MPANQGENHYRKILLVVTAKKEPTIARNIVNILWIFFAILCYLLAIITIKLNFFSVVFLC